MKEVFISGMGIISPIGVGIDPFWNALISGKSGIVPITRFDTDWLPKKKAGELQDLQNTPFLCDKEMCSLSTVGRMVLSTSRMALNDAGLLHEGKRAAEPEIDFMLATILGDAMDYMNQRQEKPEQKKQMQQRFSKNNFVHDFLVKTAACLGITGYQTINSNACAASGYAMTLAAERIRQGKTDMVLCGGVNILSKAEYIGFCSLRNLASEWCQPFDKNRQGLMIGEGCGMMVFESEASIKRRGCQPLAKLAGYGWSNDAYHLSSPHPQGWGIRASVRQALNDAEVQPHAVDCIIAHGTGTVGNDSTEAQAFADIFGSYKIPVTAPKSMLGHAMGAASVMEAITGVLTLNKKIIPPTIHHEVADENCPVDVVANHARQKDVGCCMTNSSGFGGSNSNLILKRI